MYRVIVLKDDETVAELGGSAAFLARFAPTMIGEAMAEAVNDEQYASAPQRFVMGSSDVAVGGTLPASVTVSAGQSAVAEPAKPARTRRTKAQKAADDAAQAAGFRDAAHQAETTALQGAVNEAATTQQQAAESMALPQAVPAPTQAVVTTGAGGNGSVTNGGANAGAASAPPAAGGAYNPFMQGAPTV